MVPPGRIQVPGFEESDNHFTVISKAAKSLGLHHYLSFVISNSLVRDRELQVGNLGHWEIIQEALKQELREHLKSMYV